MASTVAQIEAQSGGSNFSLDNASGQYPVVTGILCQPGTYNGRSYSYSSYLVSDGTGSAVVYGSPTGSEPVPSATNNIVGDAVSITGTYSPYNAIPELTAPVVTNQGHPDHTPGPKQTTVSAINTVNPGFGLLGYMLELDNVTIGGSGMVGKTFDGTNLTGTVSDGTGSMTLYYWPTSYSVANVNFTGKAVPTGPVDITGFVDVFSGTTAEFVPLNMTSVQTPEPGTLVLLASGFAAAAMMFLRRRKAGV